MTHNMSNRYIEDFQNHNDDTLRSDPAADTIFQLLSGARNFKLLMHALEIGLFDEIAAFGDSITAEMAAKKLQFHLGSLRKFMDGLVALGLLQKDVSSKGRVTYCNSTATNKYLTRCRKPTLIAAALMESNFVNPTLDVLPLALKQGNSGMNVMCMKKGVKTEKMDSSKSAEQKQQHQQQSPPKQEGQKASDQMMKFLLCMDGISQSCAPSLARAFDLTAHKSIVDLGGGSGSIAMEIANTYPEAKVTIFDLPPVIQMAQKIQRDVPSNATFIGGNFFEDPIPDADLYVLAHVLHDWDDECVDNLLENVYQKLPPGGSLLVLEKLLNEKRDGPLLTVTTDLVMSLISAGKERTESEYRSLFTKHGFVNTSFRRIEGINYYDAMLTRKPFC